MLIAQTVLGDNILQKAQTLAAVGRVAVSPTNLIYLAIDDAYVHDLFPLLTGPQIKKPDYFGAHDIGAHISIFYPEENKIISPQDLDREYPFKVTGFVTTVLGTKQYYVLQVEAPALVQLRQSYGLSDKLCFKNDLIDFHITIGVHDL